MQALGFCSKLALHGSCLNPAVSHLFLGLFLWLVIGSGLFCTGSKQSPHQSSLGTRFYNWLPGTGCSDGPVYTSHHTVLKLVRAFYVEGK